MTIMVGSMAVVIHGAVAIAVAGNLHVIHKQQENRWVGDWDWSGLLKPQNLKVHLQ